MRHLVCSHPSCRPCSESRGYVWKRSASSSVLPPRSAFLPVLRLVTPLIVCDDTHTDAVRMRDRGGHSRHWLLMMHVLGSLLAGGCSMRRCWSQSCLCPTRWPPLRQTRANRRTNGDLTMDGCVHMARPASFGLYFCRRMLALWWGRSQESPLRLSSALRLQPRRASFSAPQSAPAVCNH